MRNFDTIVVGLGAMGSATAYQLASHGAKVLGLEQYSLNHTNGSSHGKTRIIRTAYYEHPSYVPLVRRALELWQQLQHNAGIELLRMTGGAMFGLPGCELVSGAISSAKQHNIPHEVLTGSEAQDRFPIFQPAGEEVAVYEKNAGVLLPEECVKAQARLAEKFGAQLHYNEPVTGWNSKGNGVEVRATKETYTANSLVFSAGAWLPQLIPDLKLPLQCERQVFFWFKPHEHGTLFMVDKMPIFMWQMKDKRFFYGIPDMGDGVKAARHHGGEITSPDRVRREITQLDEAPVREFLKQHIPSLNNPPASSATCLYTNTNDEHFIIDFHPSHRNVLILSPCSGHGFKFSTAIGEVAQQLLQENKSKLNIDLFKIDRFK